MDQRANLLLVAIFAVVRVECQPESCPYKGCDCSEGTIDCGNLQWTTIPELLFTHVDGEPFLDLESNPLTTISANSLPAPISGIDFQNTPLLEIDEAAFDASSNTLQRLIFTGARFSKIPDALGHLIALQSLLVEDTIITDWNIDVMKQIGKTVTTLTIDNVSLSVWPTWIENFPHLQLLEITNSNMSAIPENALLAQKNEMITLKLENGILTQVPSAVANLSALEELVLNDNKITQLGNLPSYGNLTTLSMDNNSLSDSKMLSDLLRAVSNSLTILSLKGNKLMVFPDLSFMTKLQSVYFTDNNMDDIFTGAIPPSLLLVEAEGNNIRSIPNYVATGQKLMNLRLARNLISNVIDNLLPISVTDFDLTRNLVTELTNRSFPINSRLEYLTLDYNPLSTIDGAAFSVLKHMQYLSLRSTKLTRLPLSLVSLSPLNVVDMTLIPTLICTCLEKPLRAWALDLNLQSFGDCGNVSVDTFLKVLSADCPN